MLRRSDCLLSVQELLMPAAVASNGARLPTRERILDAVELLIASKGVYGFTLRDVAEPLGVRVPAIYKHFESRDDVLIEVSRRFIALLAAQFQPDPRLPPGKALRQVLDAFVEFKLMHPAYVRLALIDFATPGGGMEYVKLAAGGSFLDNFSAGPLAAMHARLRKLLRAGVRSREFRAVDATDFYRLVKAALLIRLVFPDDAQLLRRPTPAREREIQRWLWGIASGYLAVRARKGK
jgi:AcrR family transcriptional regulator